MIERLVRHWLRETHTPVEPGALDVELPATGCSLHAEVLHASRVGEHRFSHVELRRADGRPIVPADPVLVAALLATEAAHRGGEARDAEAVARLCTWVAEASPEDAGETTLVELARLAARSPEGGVEPDHRTGTHQVGELLAVDSSGRSGLGALLAARGLPDGAAAAAEGWLADYLELVVLPLLRGGAGGALPPPERVYLELTESGRPRAAFARLGADADGAPIDCQVDAMLLGEHVFGVVGALADVAGGAEQPAGASAAVESRLLESVARTTGIPDRWCETTAVPRAGVVNTALSGHERIFAGLRPAATYLDVPNPLVEVSGRYGEVPATPLPEVDDGWSVRRVRVAPRSQPEGDDGPPGGPDVALVHEWMNSPHVARNWQQDWSLADWYAELAGQVAGSDKIPVFALRDGEPVAYLELYRVARDKLAACYAHHSHDLGVHVAIGAPDAIGRGLGPSLLSAVARGLLAADPLCRRVVAEPDVHNAASVRAFGKAGFVRDREIGLPTKNSALMVYTAREC